MPYYGAGDYYGAGGYYQAGGLGSFLGGLAKKALGVGASLVPGGSTVLSVGSSLLGGGRGTGAMLQQQPIPGLSGALQRAAPGGLSGYYNRREYTKDGRPRRKRKDGKPWGIPTMDVGNARAMKRAVRRANRFVGLARSALAFTRYGVYTRASRAGRKKR